MTKRSGRRAAVLLPLLLTQVLVAGQHVNAHGGPGEPEIVDECMGASSHDAWADICAGWFEGTWEPVFSEEGKIVDWVLDSLIVTMRLGGRLQERPDAFGYSIRWRAGACTHLWLIRDRLDGNGVDQRFFENCGGGNITYYEIPSGDVHFTGDQITVTLPVAGVLGGFVEEYREGAELVAPAGFVWLDAWWPGIPGEFTVEWDGTESGRTFVIGQDEPPIPNEG